MKRQLAPWLIVVLSVVLLSACTGSKSSNGPGPSCTYALSPSSVTFEPGGGSTTVAVSTGNACSWTASSNSGWVSISGGASGTGNGTVSLTASANGDTAQRTATLTIAGSSVPVTQGGAAVTCTYDVSPGSVQHTKDAASGSIAVTAPAGCSWAASTSTAWITLTPPIVQGSGNGAFTYSVARNDDSADRSGSVSVANHVVSVKQSGDTGVCQYAVAPVLFTPCMAGREMTTTITTAAGCPWTVASDSAWLTIGSPGSAAGSASVTFRTSDNWDAPRLGIVMFRWPTPTAGQNVRVQQAGCHYAVSTSAIAIVPAGGTGSFDVIQQSDPMECGGPLQDACVWTATSDASWIVVTSSMPSAGDNPVHFTVAPNTTGAARTGRITVRDKVVVITQAG